MNRVIGIDPSIAATGVATPDGGLYTIKTKPKDGDGRLLDIYRELSDLIKRDMPTHAVIEDLPTHAMSAGLTGRAQGIVRLVLVQFGIPLVAIPPATLKKFATNSGKANKETMRETWQLLSERDTTDDNQVDAAFLREVGNCLLGLPALGLDLEAVDKYQGTLTPLSRPKVSLQPIGNNVYRVNGVQRSAVTGRYKTGATDA